MFRITESDVRWGGRGAECGLAGHGTAVHGRAGVGKVRYGICLVREFSICLVGGGRELGSGRIG